MADFKTIPAGTHVTWHYRGAVGHGTVTGVHKLGTSEATTEYSIDEHDHHVSESGSKEKPTVYHYGSALTRVSKSANPAEQRYVLAVAYQAGMDERIVKGADGSRDFFTPAELEKAAWAFLDGSPEVGIYHADGTTGHAQVVESYIYRGPDWLITATDGTEQVVKAGDWLLGLQLDGVAWQMHKSDQVNGVSIQGSAHRRAAE